MLLGNCYNLIIYNVKSQRLDCSTQFSSSSASGIKREIGDDCVLRLFMRNKDYSSGDQGLLLLLFYSNREISIIAF